MIGCDTHFKRALRSYAVNKCGLGKALNQSKSVQALLRFMWALSLVPKDDVVGIWENCIGPEYVAFLRDDVIFNKYQKGIDQFLDYVERNWIGELNKRTRIRKSPRFPLTMWNKYDQVLNDDPTTSNAAEGYNHALGISVPRNASIWTVIETLRTEESSFLRKLHESVLGAANPDAGKSRTYRRQQRRVDIKNIVKNYGKLSKKQYIYDLIDFFD